MTSFDQINAIEHMRRKVGSAPRGFLRNFFLRRQYFQRPKPSWLNSRDLISKIYDTEDKILVRGQVCWGAVIHANQSVYTPGVYESGAQVVYSPSAFASLEQLLDTAKRSFSLKGTQPEHPGERRLADMLTDEMERALDWPLPLTLTNGLDLVTTIVMTPRKFMPGGILAMNFLPILADPESLMAVIVPLHFWESGFRDMWRQQAEANIDNWRQQRKVYLAEIKELLKDSKEAAHFINLTPAASSRIREIMKDSKLRLDETWLRIGVQTMEFVAKHEISTGDVTIESAGISLVIKYNDLYDVQETTLDFRQQGGEVGFAFNHPRLQQEEL